MIQCLMFKKQLSDAEYGVSRKCGPQGPGQDMRTRTLAHKHIIRDALNRPAWPGTAQHGMKGKAHSQAAARVVVKKKQWLTARTTEVAAISD